jgi:hypothetical protein
MRIKERLGLVKTLQRNDLELQSIKVKTDNNIINAAKVAYTNIQPYRNALVNKIEANPEITAAQVRQLSEYTALLEAAARESARFNQYVSVELDVASLAAFEIAAKHVFDISKSFGFTPTIIPPDRMDILKQYLIPEGELMKSIVKWAPNAVDAVRQAVIDGVKLGQSPRTIAAFIRKAYGVNLTDALRMTRTTQIWSYREAIRANYIANSDVFKGWIWWANLDDRTCMSCVAQHGSVHPLSEPLDDHFNGRCTMLPYPMGLEVIDSLGRDKTGDAWFAKLNEAQQRKQMGAGMYDAWKAGKVSILQMSKQVDNNIFGSMRVETALKDLINE